MEALPVRTTMTRCVVKHSSSKVCLVNPPRFMALMMPRMCSLMVGAGFSLLGPYDIRFVGVLHFSRLRLGCSF